MEVFKFAIIAPRRTAKAGNENEKTANHPRTASPKDRDRLYIPRKEGRKALMQLE
jgi:hypothetical protein